MADGRTEMKHAARNTDRIVRRLANEWAPDRKEFQHLRIRTHIVGSLRENTRQCGDMDSRIYNTKHLVYATICVHIGIATHVRSWCKIYLCMFPVFFVVC